MDLHILHLMVISSFVFSVFSQSTMNEVLKFKPLCVFYVLEMMDGLDFHFGSHKNYEESTVEI